MKRMIFGALAVVSAVLFVASCASGPKVTAPPVSKENRPQVIDDQYHGARQTPDWVFLEPNEMEGNGQYTDVYLFKFVQQGKDIDGLRVWVNGFSAASEISRMVSTRVQDKFVGAAAGDKDKLETYMEDTVKSVSDAQYSGARKVADYWWEIQKANADGTIDQVYEYYLLYAVPKTQIDQAISRALSTADQTQPASQDEQTARDRVKAVMQQGLD